MPGPTHTPARTMAQATAELDFEVPLEAEDDRYVDLNPARGDANGWWDALAAIAKTKRRSGTTSIRS